MVAVIDYGCGNPSSVINMVRRAGGEAILTRNPEEILKADKVILPGVGSFDYGVSKLTEYNLFNIIKEFGLTEKPILGICLGMQLLGNSSEEGVLEGLSLVDANFVKFSSVDSNIKIPHVGWNTLRIINSNKMFLNFDIDDIKFYFVHSFYARCQMSANILTLTEHGNEFVSSFYNGRNIFGVQFHPEKSHKYGLKLITNFLSL